MALHQKKRRSVWCVATDLTGSAARRKRVILLLSCMALGANSGNVAAQSADFEDRPRQGASDTSNPGETRLGPRASFVEIVFSGGWIGFLIVLLLVVLSIGAVALVAEHLMTIRTAVLIPPNLAEHVRGQLARGDVPAAWKACEANPSFLAFVLRAGLAEVQGGWTPVEKAMEDATAEQAARLYRKTEYLSVIGNIAPMVGLLGTVVGMIFAFQEVAATQGAARAAELAAGIYQALVTTVGGLIVAIPALAAFAVFRNRVDQLAAEAAYAAQHALLPIKRASISRRAVTGDSATPPSRPAPPPRPTRETP